MKFKSNKIILEYGEIEMFLHESCDPIPPEIIWGCEFIYSSTGYYEDTIFADDEFYTLEEAMEWYNSTVEKYIVKENVT